MFKTLKVDLSTEDIEVPKARVTQSLISNRTIFMVRDRKQKIQMVGVNKKDKMLMSN